MKCDWAIEYKLIGIYYDVTNSEQIFSKDKIFVYSWSLVHNNDTLIEETMFNIKRKQN